MNIDFKKLNEDFKHWMVEHPKVAGLFVLVESTVAGTVVDLVANGMDFSQQGLKHAATIIGTSVVIAVRNYLRTNMSDLKKILDAKAAEQK